jgi:hypothetical protein
MATTPFEICSGWSGLHGKSFCDKRKTDFPVGPEPYMSSIWKGSAEKGKKNRRKQAFLQDHPSIDHLLISFTSQHMSGQIFLFQIDSIINLVELFFVFRSSGCNFIERQHQVP